MPCYRLQVAGIVPGKTLNGKSRFRFMGSAQSYLTRDGFIPPEATLLPCRQCVGCRLDKSVQWATRLMHESESHDNACFLTLTYDPETVPDNGSLNKAHLSTFFKDLRARCDYYGKGKIKYFACGEYGEQKGRPHYHVALFGPFGCYGDDSGRAEEEPSRSGDRQFTHEDISACWEYGIHRFSELSFESAAYVARYVLKKVTGPSSPDFYGDRVPEFQVSSNGLGKAFFEKNAKDVFPSDQVVIPGRGSWSPPEYYLRLLEKRDPELFARVKEKRKEEKEELTKEELASFVERRDREGHVKRLVAEATLIRGVDL